MNSRGSSLLEVIIAITILAIGSNAYIFARREAALVKPRVQAGAVLITNAPELARKAIDTLSANGKIPLGKSDFAELTLVRESQDIFQSRQLPAQAFKWIVSDFSESSGQQQFYRCRVQPVQKKTGNAIIPVSGLMAVDITESIHLQTVTLILPIRRPGGLQ
ncbi:MAG: hypothetical protein CVV64_09380 [Candidatus Wallbacteria bacterium HGW-Wallbacteria-1]|jgi:prepilin-type N-terminal cleavage/methylation domain-containing protein|uniref:Uncharacterized protein n=1 Tax=Candidatus Wallbacteria bacterium HGW-Wallbacteria-1 TaxID=2013854 RepID=A0A2N1PQL2_9BACT|nr:MAG: hypothetical protein CVV64_09380 [Candidatus Wallbacteria bacterium HGW-Wallbacteria-1]